ncbi:putative salt tolerance-like protein [Corchorus capsularis]|uniref:Putative salt tolerance-like protein n=1 Tax=Corchorus capsularis TaxID=210143 RepID=A0A1R3HF41_COCAP|nr:putative salt tolerance-like protein [Corchorus capsularis]
MHVSSTGGLCCCMLIAFAVLVFMLLLWGMSSFFIALWVIVKLLSNHFASVCCAMLILKLKFLFPSFFSKDFMWVKLSANSALYTSSSSSSLSNASDSVPDFKSQPLIKNLVSASPANLNPFSSLAKSSSSNINGTTAAAAVIDKNNNTGDNNLMAISEGVGSTSSISEYLIKMLPGWHVQDFLDSSPPPFGFCKNDDGMLPLFDADIGSNMSSTNFSTENLGLWVPQSPCCSMINPPQYSSQMGGQIGLNLKETKKIIGMKANRRS